MTGIQFKREMNDRLLFINKHLQMAVHRDMVLLGFGVFNLVLIAYILITK